MDRQAKVASILQRVEAARGRLAKKKKAKREARERDAETLKPDEYRDRHGRCPPGYNWEADEERCKKADQKPDEPREQGEEKEQKEQTPEERKAARKAQDERLLKLFDEDFDKYSQEVDRLRKEGKLPDRETATMLAKIKNLDDLPEDVRNDKEKLAEIIDQQSAQREHEVRVLQRTEQVLRNVQNERERAERAGRKPPRVNLVKLLNEVDNSFGRELPERSEKMNQILEDEADDFLAMVTDAADDKSQPSYWWKQWFRRMFKPAPALSFGGGGGGGGKRSGGSDLGLDILGASTEASMNLAAVLDAVAVDLDSRGSALASAVDRAAERLDTGRVTDLGAGWATAKTMTSPGITNMAPSEIGFPPYDRERPEPVHVPNEPSGRPAFPPYGPVVTVEYPERDARMQGFPPYDGKGEPHDTATVGLPPYNGKAPHKGRGFPPYHDGKNVYDHRDDTVRMATSAVRTWLDYKETPEGVLEFYQEVVDGLARIGIKTTELKPHSYEYKGKKALARVYKGRTNDGYIMRIAMWSPGPRFLLDATCAKLGFPCESPSVPKALGRLDGHIYNLTRTNKNVTPAWAVQKVKGVLTDGRKHVASSDYARTSSFGDMRWADEVKEHDALLRDWTPPPDHPYHALTRKYGWT